MSRSLYQKYRPATFKDVVEQSSVVSVLERAIASGTPGHAYLFTGSRGIGKTSVARVFAKALGCEDVDIFEIDAASHTSVENVRDLTESVYSKPVQSPYKVYILDEVHMLSRSAFNAFLKTLEEPPAHAIFILVTTELSKVPETITSRCISLEFVAPSQAVLRSTIMDVASKEGFTILDETATLIALIADGSFRDALTLLQKVLTVSGKTKKVKHDLAAEVLGAPKQDVVYRYLTALTEGDVTEGAKALEQIAATNANVELFGSICVQKVRSAILYREIGESVTATRGEEDAAFIADLSKRDRISTDLLRSLIDARQTVSQSHVRTLPFELLLVDAHDQLTGSGD